MALSLEADALIDCFATWSSALFLNFLYTVPHKALWTGKKMRYIFAIYFTVVLILPPSKILEK